MSDSIRIGKRVRTFESSPRFDAYSRVVIVVSDELEYSAGAETGRTITLECPWGTQEMAENILSSIQGFKYQPYRATGAILNPAAELGDAVTVLGTYSGIYTLDATFGSTFTATLSAPHEEEVDHEFPYVSKQERKIERQFRNVKSTFRVQADLIEAEVRARAESDEDLMSKLSVQTGLIEAKVSKSGGKSTTFGWSLDDDSWTIKGSGTDILKATKNGLEVYGKVTATSGKIGGFEIESDYLSYNGQKWTGTDDIASGIYIGPSGIRLGKNFKVDSTGNLTANSGTFTGSVRAGSIQYGGNYGTLSGSGISASSLTTTQFSGGIKTSLGYADFSNGVFNEYNTATTVKCQSIKIDRSYFKPVTIFYTNASGGTSQITVLGYR